MNKKGDSAAFVIALILIFVMGFMYIGLRHATDETYATVSVNAYNFTDGNHNDSAEALYTIFKWFPMIVVFVIFLWLILASLRRKEEGY